MGLSGTCAGRIASNRNSITQRAHNLMALLREPSASSTASSITRLWPLTSNPTTSFYTSIFTHRRPSGLRLYTGRPNPGTALVQYLTGTSCRRTICGTVKQHFHHRTRSFVGGIAAGNARQSRSPDVRVVSPSGRGPTTPRTHCGC